MKLIHRHDEKIQKIEDLTAELEKSPAIRKMREEQSEENLKQRHETVEKIRELEQERDALVSLREEISKLEAKVKTKDSERLKAVAELQKARSTYTGKNESLQTRIGILRGSLSESCDVKIREAEEFFKGRLQWLREPGRISSQHLGLIGRDLINDTVKGKIESNCGAVKQALVYCQASLRRLEEMKQAPDLDFGMIDKLKDGFPNIDSYDSVEETRALPGSRVPNPLSLLPSSSQVEYEMNKLLEKARKILRK